MSGNNDPGSTGRERHERARATVERKQRILNALEVIFDAYKAPEVVHEAARQAILQIAMQACGPAAGSGQIIMRDDADRLAKAASGIDYDAFCMERNRWKK